MDVGVVVLGDLAKDLKRDYSLQFVHLEPYVQVRTHLHAHDSVDEENEPDEDCDPGEGLEGLDKGPEQRPDALALAQQLDQPHHAEEAEKVDGDHVAARLQSCKKYC